MYRRTILFEIVFLLVGTLMFAGGGQESETATAEKGKTITFQTFLTPGGDSPRERAWGQIIERFTEKTGIQVETNILPWQDVDPQLILGVQSGNPPDVSFVRDKSFMRDMQAGALLSLDDYIARDFDQATIDDYVLWNEDGMYDGKKYAFHMHYTPVALYIRKDLLEAAGLRPPKTWQEFIEVGKALAQGGTAGYLYTVSPAQPAALDYLQPMIEGRGGQVLTEDGRAAFDREPGLETYRFLKSLVFENGVSPRSTATAKYDEVTDAFSSGRVGMIIEGAHRYNRIADALGKDNILLAYIPSDDPDTPSPTSVSGWNLGIPRGSGDPDAAWEFIKFSTSPEAQLIYTRVGGQLPVRTSVLDDPYFDSEEGRITAWFVEYMNRAGSLALSPPTYQQLSEILSVALQQTLSAPSSNVERILADAAEKYNSVVKNQ